MNIVLANKDYERHMTDEGSQLQLGLEHAGWHLTGYGYDDSCTDVAELVRRWTPKMVFVQDPRDWDEGSPGCFDKRVSFRNIEALRGSGVVVATVIKDAGSVREYQRRMFERCGATIAVVYYEPAVVRQLNPWLENTQLVRTYHSVNANVVPRIGPGSRRRLLISGADSDVYPLRRRAVAAADYLGADVLQHPGYGNKGAATPGYLEKLSNYKTHLTTASKYGFALRKIIESVACGCIPITDLQHSDVLPHIDGALLRVPSNVSMRVLRGIVNACEERWSAGGCAKYAEVAVKEYDYRVIGERLSRNLLETGGCHV